MSLGSELVNAVAAQDESALQACFAADVQFHALTPPGVRERTGAAETVALISAWFADSTELDLVDTHTEEVGDRLYISYRFHGVEEGEPYVVEHHLYYNLGDGVIERAELLCSGFGPRGG
jgi:hypothetical protein